MQGGKLLRGRFCALDGGCVIHSLHRFFFILNRPVSDFVTRAHMRRIAAAQASRLLVKDHSPNTISHAGASPVVVFPRHKPTALTRLPKCLPPNRLACLFYIFLLLRGPCFSLLFLPLGVVLLALVLGAVYALGGGSTGSRSRCGAGQWSASVLERVTAEGRAGEEGLNKLAFLVMGVMATLAALFKQGHRSGCC